MTDLNRSRLTTWWLDLDTETQERLLVLDEHDALPEDVVPNLRDHGIHPAKGRYGGYVQPGELVQFLAEQRRGNA
ncbi:hypothetical protein [Streptomyces turgidiscabies]|uniref:hypothetical protein n=1 Tax=Streptomyces turgidiscabies TaxID=85558 RepID=UPI0038F6B857